MYYFPLVTYFKTNDFSVEDKPAFGAILAKIPVQFEEE